MLTSDQRSFLSSLASAARPSVMVGKRGETEAVREQLRAEFTRRELVKIRFVDFKDEKTEIAERLADASGAELVRVIGNAAILYRPSDDKKKRLIRLP